MAEKTALLALYKELNTITWAGTDEGWDLAIDAVRKRILELAKSAPQILTGEERIIISRAIWVFREKDKTPDANSTNHGQEVRVLEALMERDRQVHMTMKS